MKSLYQEFEDEFREKFSFNELKIVNKLIKSACEATIKHNDYITELEDWNCSLDIEKHNALNFTYYINIYNEKYENIEIDLTFHFGVDASNELSEYSFEGISSKYEDKEVEVLSDLKLNEEKVKQHFINSNNVLDNVPNDFILDNLINKAKIVFEREKSNILEIYGKMNYDNYVTGGGTSLTKDLYQKKFDKYHKIGLYWITIYETEIVDRNLH